MSTLLFHDICLFFKGIAFSFVVLPQKMKRGKLSSISERKPFSGCFPKHEIKQKQFSKQVIRSHFLKAAILPCREYGREDKTQPAI